MDRLESEVLDAGQVLHISDCFDLNRGAELVLVVDNVSYVAEVTDLHGHTLFVLCRVFVVPADFDGLMLPLPPRVTKALKVAFRTWAALATRMGPSTLTFEAGHLVFEGGEACPLVLS